MKTAEPLNPNEALWGYGNVLDLIGFGGNEPVL